MEIKKINLNGYNLESIHDSLKKNPKGFSNIPEVFNQVNLSVLLNCDMVSLYFIKQISDKFKITCETVLSPSEYSGDGINNELLVNSTRALLATRNAVYTDGYVGAPQNIDLLLPISTFKYSVEAHISTEGLMKIYHGEVASMFANNVDSFGNFLIPNKFNKDEIDTICARRFNSYIVNQTEKFMHYSSTSLTDMMNKEYFSVISSNTGFEQTAMLAGIYNSEGGLKFFNTKPDELNSKMNSSPVLNNPTITLCMRTTFKDFVEIICNDSVSLVAYDNINKFIGSGIDVDRIKVIIDNYSLRLTQCITGIKSSVNDMIKSDSKTDYRNGFLSLFNSQMINYVVDITNWEDLSDPTYGEQMKKAIQKALLVCNHIEKNNSNR